MASSEIQQTDVVVVGSGGAGLCAAIEARAAGAQVVIIEREATLGGATAISGGGCCLADTPLQRQQGINDSVELAFQDWVAFGGGAADEAWARFYLEHTLHDLYFWLEERGVRWIGLQHQEGNSVPRWHRPQDGGSGIWQALHRTATALGVCYWWTSCAAKELLREGERVVGVAVEDRESGRVREVRAGAVVMATGGFNGNLDKVLQYRPELRGLRILVGGHEGATGDGHGLVEGAGGVLTHMDQMWLYAFATPDPKDPRGWRGLVVRGLPDYLWVNAQGRRFHNESLPGGASGTSALLAQRPPWCWAVFDQAMRPGLQISDPYFRTGSEPLEERIEAFLLTSPFARRADSLAELARSLGVPEEGFVETVERYNGAIQRGLAKDPEFERPLAGRRPLAEPLFYALQFFPLARKNFGGVKTDLRCRVLNQDLAPIPGLYAAGELAGMAGGHINGKNGLEGTMLGPSLFSGRVAGAWAAQEAGYGPGFVGKPRR